MKRREKDFGALYNALWYRDFPVMSDPIWVMIINSKIQVARN